MIEFDPNGRKLALDESVVRDLRGRALAGAGSSSTLNDLAVILTRALSEQKQITLGVPSREPWNVCLGARRDRLRWAAPLARSTADA
jgi:hypothetical protein